MADFHRTRFPEVQAGGGGGSTTFNQYTIFGEKILTSYATGGFVVDLSQTFSSINFFDLCVKKGTRGNIPFGRFEFDYDTPNPGKVTVIIRKYQYVRVSSFDAVTGQPAGVTVAGTSGQTTSSEAAHTHDLSHDHAAAASAAMTAAGAGVDTDALAPALDTHTHQVDLPNLAVTSGAGTSHNHTNNTIYAHTHTLTQPATNLTAIQLPNATDTSATTFLFMATGLRG